MKPAVTSGPPTIRIARSCPAPRSRHPRPRRASLPARNLPWIRPTPRESMPGDELRAAATGQAKGEVIPPACPVSAHARIGGRPTAASRLAPGRSPPRTPRGTSSPPRRADNGPRKSGQGRKGGDPTSRRDQDANGPRFERSAQRKDADPPQSRCPTVNHPRAAGCHHRQASHVGGYQRPGLRVPDQGASAEPGRVPAGDAAGSGQGRRRSARDGAGTAG